MFGLALVVASIGLADSINPSTLVPALWLASTPQARGVGSFVLGVFAVYLAGGLVLVFGPGPPLIAALHRLGGPVEHGLEVAFGALALWSRVLAVAFAAQRRGRVQGQALLLAHVGVRARRRDHGRGAAHGVHVLRRGVHDPRRAGGRSGRTVTGDHVQRSVCGAPVRAAAGPSHR